MALISNIEFSCENGNFLEDPSLNKKIQQGIEILRRITIIDGDIENDIRINLDSLQTC